MKKHIILIAGISLLTGFLLGRYFIITPNAKTQEVGIGKIEEHWTCSMHPQIDLPEPGQCPICGMDLIPKSKQMENHNPEEILLTPEAVAWADLQTIIIDNNPNNISNETVRYPGSIEVNPENNSLLTAHIGGRIEKLTYQKKGSYVTKGSLIALLYAPELALAQSELKEAAKTKATQPDLYQAIRNKLRNKKISDRQIDKLENGSYSNGYFPIYADQSGYIKQIQVSTGDYIKEGDILYRLEKMNNVLAVIEIYEKDIKHYTLGQNLQIKINAYPEKTWTSKIHYISPVVDSKKRTTEIHAIINNPNNKLKPGMLLEAEIPNNSISTKQSEKYQIPKSSVLWTGKRSIVYLKIPGTKNAYKLQEVILGKEGADTYEVVSGIKAGDELVINGAFTLDAEAQLQGKKSMTNRKKSSQNTSDNLMKCGSGKCGGM